MAKSKKSPVTVRGPWIANSLDFLRSRACAELSPQGLKMLVDLWSQLGPNARGNGDLSAAPTTMSPRGWTGNSSRVAALQELVDAELIIVTREGDRRRCKLYAITLWPMDCDVSKLDHGPGCYSTLDWEKKGTRNAPPTSDAPAVWRSLRKGEAKKLAKSPPAAGNKAVDMNPQWDDREQFEVSYVPAAGSQRTKRATSVYPQRDTFLDTPSAGVAVRSSKSPQKNDHTPARPSKSANGSIPVTADVTKA